MNQNQNLKRSPKDVAEESEINRQLLTQWDKELKRRHNERIEQTFSQLTRNEILSLRNEIILK